MMAFESGATQEQVTKRQEQNRKPDSPTIERFFTKPNESPFDAAEWEYRSVKITDSKGNVIFQQDDVQAPSFWSQFATDIVVSKYFRGHVGSASRETSIAQVITRVVDTITESGVTQGYFKHPGDAETFRAELAHVILHQMGTFNSPVWFNVGAVDHPQSAGCFVLPVEDDMGSILDLARTEAMIFKGGSGTGTNLSTLRGKNEKLSGGGTASGPLSFMKGYDAFTAAVKSGGRCLPGHQRVYTESGPVPVAMLAEKPDGFIVLSYDPPAGRIKAKKASAWLSGEKNIVKITTDKGEFQLSEDHPVRLAGNGICQAGQLQPGMSLHAGTIDMARHGHYKEYMRVHLQNGKKGKLQFHRLIAMDVLGWNIEGRIIHHKDGNTFNNNPDNLELMSQAEHAALHGHKIASAGNHIFQLQQFGHGGALNGMHKNGSFWANETKVTEYQNKQRAILLSRDGAARKMQVAAATQKTLNTFYKLRNIGCKLDTFDEYVAARKHNLGDIPSIKKLKSSIDARFGNYDKMVAVASENNHRVVSIEHLGAMPVYSVEVECPTADDKSVDSGHNFLIWSGDALTGSGVFVLNTRRAAKLVILDIDHPDILDFIRCKANEEKKARALIAAGYDSSMDGEAYATVAFQNSNNSVRISDEFMKAEERGDTWETRARTTGEVMSTHKARSLLMEIATATHQCGDPGVQFDTTINRFNTCKKSGRINASNACSEVQFLDNSACNLASINLLRFVSQTGVFDITAFEHVVDLFITAQDILVDMSSYPTPKIEENSKRFRPLGLGYTNLGATLMSMGLPYDSDDGRQIAAAITALMTGRAYRQSANLAELRGPFAEYEKNTEPMQEVIDLHTKALYETRYKANDSDVMISAKKNWQEAKTRSKKYGFRNAQVSLLAPCGTISFMMDGDTTGIEPDFSLVKTKSLVGGSVMKIHNAAVPRALKRLGYSDEESEEIVAYILENGSPESMPLLAKEHLPVFDCAARPANGSRYIAPMGHVKMCAAVQPFLTGAISKTVNVPRDATPEDIADLYIKAWKLGIKAMAVYRDGSKSAQPLQTQESKSETAAQPAVVAPKRHRLPEERVSVTHKFSIVGHEGYVTVGQYEDGTPGEMFIRMSKAGSVISGLMDGFALSISLALQYGVPLEVLVDKYTHTRFEPSGFTTNKNIPMTTSILDYIFRWMGAKYLTDDQPIPDMPQPVQQRLSDIGYLGKSNDSEMDGPPCPRCGSIMVRSGTCHTCRSCGTSGGCG